MRVVSEEPEVVFEKIRKCVKKLSKFVGMWDIDKKLIVSPSKNHKIPENIWPWIIHYKYLQQTSSFTSTSLYNVSRPKVAFFHRFWLKGHRKLSSTTKRKCA